MTALREAYELIKDEGDWCQRTLSRTHPSGIGVQRCASAALASAHATNQEHNALSDTARALFPDLAYRPGSLGPVVAVNDVLGHAAVMQMFEKTIVELEGSL